jgi:hemerythrin
MTLKHNLIESMYMEGIVPSAHRIAHNQAHMDIAQQLKEIRVVFSGDGNGIQAIEGIDRVRQTLLTHFQEHDQQLENYLAAAVASN